MLVKLILMALASPAFVMAIDAQKYVLPSLSSFCPQCKQLPISAYNALENLHDTSLPAPSVSRCGDGICNTAVGESCGTCPQDCGSCGYTMQLQSCVNKKYASLTFDDGPSKVTVDLLAELKKLNVKATFFVNAFRVNDELDSSQLTKAKGWTSASSYAKLIKQAYDEGHVIGSHTYSHVALAQGRTELTPSADHLPLPSMRMQLLLNDITIKDIIGKAPLAFRPPYLDMNTTVLNLLESMGYIPISINADTKDFSFQNLNHTESVKAILEQTTRVLDTFSGTDGPLFLQHDLYASSVAATAGIVEALRKKQFQVVPLNVCLGMTPESFYRRESTLLFNKQDSLSSSSATSNTTTTTTPSSETSTRSSPTIKTRSKHAKPTSRRESTTSTPSKLVLHTFEPSSLTKDAQFTAAPTLASSSTSSASPTNADANSNKELSPDLRVKYDSILLPSSFAYKDASLTFFFVVLNCVMIGVVLLQ